MVSGFKNKWLGKIHAIETKLSPFPYGGKISNRHCRVTFSTFFCFCGAIGLPRGICFNFCISENGYFFSRGGSLFQGDGFGENLTFARGVLFWFSFSLTLSNFGVTESTCKIYTVVNLRYWSGKNTTRVREAKYIYKSKNTCFSSPSSDDDVGCSSEPAKATLLFFWETSFCLSIPRGSFGVSGTTAESPGVVLRFVGFGVVSFSSEDVVLGLFRGFR